jgi:hypothetical protein
MTVLPRGARPRRGGRRPGWLLLTVLLVLAILASSALVFTDRVELLKLAVILALWAAVVAAFVSVIYRRQSDLDQAKARDLKLVYDLQLDREISARREYELTVESQLRRELASELRAQAADEVAALRAELAALRANLEILFDADLSHRPAIENDKTTARAAGRVTSSRLDVPSVEDTDIHSVRTEESPIIDVPAEPHPAENDWAAAAAAAAAGGAHRLPTQRPDQPRRRRLPDDYQAPPRQQEPPHPAPPAREPRRPAAEAPQPQSSWAPPPPPPTMPPMEPSPTIDIPAAERTSQPSSPWSPPGAPPHKLPEQPPAGWQPAPAEGQFIPAGAPGSNWVAPPTQENGVSNEYVGRRRAPEEGEPAPPAEAVAPAPPSGPDVTAPPTEAVSPAPPSMAAQAPEPPRGRHYASGQPQAAPVLATEPSQPPPQPEPEPEPESDEANGQHAGGQSVSELLARFQSAPAQGGGRRRRDE